MNPLEKLKAASYPVPTPPPLPSEADVANAEEKLGVAFPPSYRTYQPKYSDLSYGAFEPYSLVEDGSFLDLVSAVEDAREQGLPEHLIPFVEDNGDYYCFDLTTQAPEYKVRFWSHDGVSNESWDSFLDWVERCWLEEEG